MTTETTITAEQIKDPAPAGWELKNVKINRTLSEETLCYSASLYVDGRKVADVSNRGHGGPTDILFIPGVHEARALNTVKGTQTYGDTVFDPRASLEITLDEMAEDSDVKKTARRQATKTKSPIIVYAEDGRGGFFFNLHSLDNLATFLTKFKATRYRVFDFTA